MGNRASDAAAKAKHPTLVVQQSPPADPVAQEPAQARQSFPGRTILRRVSKPVAAGTSILLAALAATVVPGIVHSVERRLDPPADVRVIVAESLSNYLVVKQPLASLGTPPGHCSSNEYLAWARNLHGVQGFNDVAVSIKVNTDAIVLFKGIEVHVLDRSPPVRGTVLHCPVGDGPPPLSADVDLESSPAKITYYRDDRDTKSSNLTYKISKGQDFTLPMDAFSTSHTITWNATVVLTIDGRRRTFPISPQNGSTFVVTPMNTKDKAYYWDGTRWN